MFTFPRGSGEQGSLSSPSFFVHSSLPQILSPFTLDLLFIVNFKYSFLIISVFLQSSLQFVFFWLFVTEIFVLRCSFLLNLTWSLNYPYPCLSFQSVAWRWNLIICILILIRRCWPWVGASLGKPPHSNCRLGGRCGWLWWTVITP